MEDFVSRALIASLAVSVIAGSLGCFVIWKRLSYFSDSISHSALLGVGLGIISGLGINFGLIIVGAIFEALVVFLQQKDLLSNDAILGIFSHIALSVGIVVLGLLVIRIRIILPTCLAIFFPLQAAIYIGYLQLW